MVLAILLFNRYGIEQDYLKRQFDSVSRLLSTLSKMRFFMTVEAPVGAMLQIRPLDPFATTTFELWYERAVAFPSYAFELLSPLEEHRNDLFLPIPIAEKLDRLVPVAITEGGHAETKLAEVIFLSASPGAPKPKDMCFGFENTEMTLLDFLSRWADVVEKIDDWMKQNSANAPKLNAPHLRTTDNKPMTPQTLNPGRNDTTDGGS